MCTVSSYLETYCDHDISKFQKEFGLTDGDIRDIFSDLDSYSIISKDNHYAITKVFASNKKPQ